MKTSIRIISTAVAVSCLSLAACTSKSQDFIGDWKSIAPINVASDIYGADSATEEISLSFEVPSPGSDGITSIKGNFNVVRPVPCDSVNSSPVKVSFSASASCSGTWTYDVDDADDLLMLYDYNTISVEIENSGITVSGADSIPAHKLEAFKSDWKREVENSFRSTLTRFSVIEDVEVDKNKSRMKLEINNPKAKLRFVRTM